MRYALTLVGLALGSVCLADTIEIRDALALGGVMRGSRNPLPSDSVLESLIDGSFSAPTAGATWKKVDANKDGWFVGDLFENAYVFATVDSPTDRTALLDASGHSLVYVNGEMRGGDPYGYGYLTLPIHLKKGLNELIFVSARGRMRASIKDATKPLELDLRDSTTPDILTTDKGTLLAGFVVRNAGSSTVSGLQVRITEPGKRASTRTLPSIDALTIRKVPVSIPVPAKPIKGNLDLKIELLSGGHVIDTQKLPLRVLNPNEVYKRTFISRMDSSVQYFAVNPAQKPARSNLLTLTVHGAGVEALGQAQAYGSKEDVTIVAATNRRPYGFDWEDPGRTDALEVLAIAKKSFPHDPARVHLTGHSMGGHGTWHIGTLYPDTFASIAPAAGWISFWSYAGGWNPEKNDPVLGLFRRSLNAGETLGRLNNTLAQGVFILHGDADDNVPVTEARTMRRELQKINHPDLGYHEVPGAGHWWGGESVDFPGIFAMQRRRKLETLPDKIDFTTQNPAVSAHAWWATILQQEKSLTPSRIKLSLAHGSVMGTTSNVASVKLDLRKLKEPLDFVTLDGQVVSVRDREVVLTKTNGTWSLTAKPAASQKSPDRGGPFKQVLDHNFALVVPTGGTAEENEWALAKARYDAETWEYRGNGALDVVRDTDLSKLKDANTRNLIVYGNADTNKAWKSLLKDSPVQIHRDGVTVGTKKVDGSFTSLFIRPRKGCSTGLVAVIGGTDLAALKRTNRLPVFTSGLNYPDWCLIDKSGVTGAGFFDNSWNLNAEDSAWKQP